MNLRARSEEMARESADDIDFRTALYAYVETGRSPKKALAAFARRAMREALWSAYLRCCAIKVAESGEWDEDPADFLRAMKAELDDK